MKKSRSPNASKEIKLRWMKTLEDTPENPLTRERLMKWVAHTQYVENFIKKRIHQLDKPYLDDYIQECWVQILEVPEDKILEIYRRGKGKFTNYIKSIIMHNIKSNSSILFRNLRRDKFNEVYLSDNEWVNLEETGETDFITPNEFLGLDDNKEAIKGFETQHLTTEQPIQEKDILINVFEESQREIQTHRN